MQEVESTKLLKDTLEAGGLQGRARRRRHADQCLGRSGAPAGRRSRSSPRSTRCPAARRRPARIERKPLVKGAPGHMEGHNTHGGVAIGRGLRREAGDAALSTFRARWRSRSVRPRSNSSAGRSSCAPAISRTSTRSSICTSATTRSTGYGLQNYAAISSKFTFHGKTAHGAVNPWDGKDAVDAVELMDIGFDKLREHLRPTYRAHRTITVGGIQPNIIPDTGQIWWFVRDATDAGGQGNLRQAASRSPKAPR